MRTTITTFFTLSMLASAGAQNVQPSSLRVHDGSNEIYTRGQLGALGGECLMRMRGDSFGGVGKATGVSATLYDAWGADCHSYHVVIRKAKADGTPDLSPSGVLHQVGPIRSRCDGFWWRKAVGYRVSTTFKGPVALPEEGFFYGIRLMNAPSSYPSNGLRVYASGDPTNECGEYPRSGVSPDSAWNVFYLGPNPSHAVKAGGFAWDIRLHVEGPALQPYAVDTVGTSCAKKKGVKDLGYAGLWPTLGASHAADFGWRIHSGNDANGAAFVFLSCSKLANGIDLPQGRLWIDPRCLLIAQFTVLNGSGEGFSPAIRLPKELRGLLSGASIYAQAMAINQATGKTAFTNWSRTSF